MTITSARFLVRHPEFSDASVFPVDRIDFYLEDLEKYFDLGIWSAFYEEGVCLLTAHKLVVETALKESPGDVNDLAPVLSKSIGDVSVSFAQAMALRGEEGVYALTYYGRAYVELRDTQAIDVVAVW